MRTRLPGMRHLEIYGLSETHSPATMCTDDELVARPGSVGRPLPCMEAMVVDESGDAVEAGGAGELWLRGSLVTTGYHADPTASAAAMRDGWFVTGDVARIDDEGYVWILDRTKDMINRGGHKVSSAEIERVLGEHPMVEEAAVVGVPDRTGGEAIAAVWRSALSET